MQFDACALSWWCRSNVSAFCESARPVIAAHASRDTEYPPVPFRSKTYLVGGKHAALFGRVTARLLSRNSDRSILPAVSATSRR